MKKLSLTYLALSLVSLSAYAENSEQRIAARLDDVRAMEQNLPMPPHQTALGTATKTAQSQAQRLTMSKAEFAKQPDLVVRALMAAVSQNNGEAVDLVFPIYQQIPAQFQDPLLTRWGSAIYAKNQGNLTASIADYRQILAEQPDLTLVRLQLASALFNDNQLEAAEDQFQKLRAENQNEPTLRSIVDQYLAAITHQDRWTFSGGLTYLNDPNINNAPKSGTTYGNWQAPKAESAQGVGLNFNLGKKWSWGNGFYNEFRLDGNSKYYWNNRKYNEASGRASVGLGFQNAKWNLAVLPFMEQSLYAGGKTGQTSYKRFSQGGGATLEASYWLNPQWQLNANYEFMELRYATRKHLNGNYHYLNGGITYLANAKRYYFANLNFNRTSTRDKDDSFIRRGISIGWGQEWDKGFSTRLSLSYAQKNYQAPMPIFGITQRNKEFGVQASVWHRAVHFMGITPRLTYSFNKVKSNHSFYSYDKHRVFIDFSKRF